MDERMRSFIERLNFGQPYLLLGQQYLAETITDKFYEVVSERLGSNKKDTTNLSVWKRLAIQF